MREDKRIGGGPVCSQRRRRGADWIKDHDTIVCPRRPGHKLSCPAAEVEHVKAFAVDAACVQERADLFGQHRQLVRQLSKSGEELSMARGPDSRRPPRLTIGNCVHVPTLRSCRANVEIADHGPPSIRTARFPLGYDQPSWTIRVRPLPSPEGSGEPRGSLARRPMCRWRRGLSHKSRCRPRRLRRFGHGERLYGV
jgi:hypothetical protein